MSKCSDELFELVDGIERRREQWRREMPEVDTKGMAIIGRARFITLNVRAPIEAIFARHGIDSGEADVLFTLLRSGAPYRLRPTELFKSLMITSGGLTFRVNRLVKRDLVRRIDDMGDRRSLMVELTAAGVECARAAFREDMALEADMLSTLTTDEQRQLAMLLRKLIVSFEPSSERECGSIADWSTATSEA